MSFALRIINTFAKGLIRPSLRYANDPLRARKAFGRATKLLPLPKSVTVQQADGALRLVPTGALQDRMVVYFHGGGYIMGAPETHSRLAALIAERSGTEVVLPRYRLCPEHAAPASFDDALAAYRRIAARTDKKIILGGDSAGGGLAFAVLAALKPEDRKPSGIFAFSPWSDLAQSDADRAASPISDRLFPMERFEELCALLGNECPLDDPRLSPARARFDAPPPSLIQVAKTEALWSDATRLTEALEKGGGHVTLSTLPDGPHVWQMLDLILPEARESLDEVGAFVRGL